MAESFRQILFEARDAGRPVAVVGLGRSGFETASFLSRVGIRVVVWDDSTEESYVTREGNQKRLSELRESGVSCFFAPEEQAFLEATAQVCLVVVSPGVPFQGTLVSHFRSSGIPTTNDLELGLTLIGKPYVLVTGSNGKSTTVSLIEHVLRSADRSVALVGNIGTPPLAALSSLEPRDTECADWYVVEASSFQIESARGFEPKIAVFTNISANHLDRHGDLDTYFEIKSTPFRAMRVRDLAILNREDERVMTLADEIVARVATFGGSGLESGDGAVIHIDENVDEIHLFRGKDEYAVRLSQSKLIGLHNRKNMAAAALVALELDVPAEQIGRALLSFESLPHRFEPVREGDRIVINDSKATSVDAAKAALYSAIETFPCQQIFVLLGGRDKGGFWQELSGLFRLHRRLVPILFGECREVIGAAFRESGLAFEIVPSCREALNLAWERSDSGDVILLSPGGSSFDEFSSFEERGDRFRAWVDMIPVLA